jgi:hypothetical protein
MYFLLGDLYQLGQGSSSDQQYWLVQVDSAGIAATAIYSGNLALALILMFSNPLMVY